MRANDGFESQRCVKATAQAFLDAFGEATFTFQTFDDNSACKDRRLVRILNGTIEERFAELESLNRRGAGVFVTINRTDGKGRESCNIIGVRAVFVDLDGSPLAPV